MDNRDKNERVNKSSLHRAKYDEKSDQLSDGEQYAVEIGEVETIDTSSDADERGTEKLEECNSDTQAIGFYGRSFENQLRQQRLGDDQTSNSDHAENATGQ